MSVISEIQSHFESIESRHFWIAERLDQAARLASQHRYQADEIAEVLSANTDPGDEWGMLGTSARKRSFVSHI